MNKVILCGRLTRDPETRYSEGATPMAISRFTLAVDRKKKGETSADFINCIAFDKKGEFVGQYLRQGTKVLLVGHIQTGSYTNKNGVKVYTTDIITEEIEFAESKKTEGSSNDGFVNVPDDVPNELPFD